MNNEYNGFYKSSHDTVICGNTCSVSTVENFSNFSKSQWMTWLQYPNQPVLRLRHLVNGFFWISSYWGGLLPLIQLIENMSTYALIHTNSTFFVILLEIRWMLFKCYCMSSDRWCYDLAISSFMISWRLSAILKRVRLPHCHATESNHTTNDTSQKTDPSSLCICWEDQLR